MFYPGHHIKFARKRLGENAGLVLVQWQKGMPITVYPPELAVADPICPKR
jgi:branched-chain amino acid transport system substrate-binding protein